MYQTYVEGSFLGIARATKIGIVGLLQGAGTLCMATRVELIGEEEIGTIGAAVGATHTFDSYIDIIISCVNNAGGLAGKVDNASALKYPHLVMRVMLSGPGSSVGLVIGNISGGTVDVLPEDGMLNKC